MSTFSVDIVLGSSTFTVTSADDPADPELVYVLDGLRITWANAEDVPQPAQPSPVGARLALLTADVANLADLDIGTTGQIIVSSDGVTVAAFAGRVGDVTATPIRHNGAQMLKYEILLGDYLVDLAELTLTLNRPQEVVDARLAAIVAAVAAAGGPTITAPGIAGVSPALYEPLVDVTGSALDLIEDCLRQNNGGSAELPARATIRPVTAAGVLTGYKIELWDGNALTWGPGTFELNAGVLEVVFDDPAPADLEGAHLGLTVDGCRVDEDVDFRLAKFGTANSVVVTYANGTETATGDDGDTRVSLALSSTLTSSDDAQLMAQMYLPHPAALDRWSIDRFSWEPTDAELAAMPFPLTPDTDTDELPPCYVAQVAVSDVPPAINPSNDSPFYAGTLDGVELTITGGTVRAQLTIGRRIATPWPDTVSGVFYGVRPVDLAADFPTVTVAQVDPTLSVYETRLVRRDAL